MYYLEKMTALSGPKLHVCELAAESRAEFARRLQLELPQAFSKISLPGEELASPTRLFVLSQSAFHFPEYFGHNWAAWDECLNDLEWLDASGYLVWIDGAERIDLTGPDLMSFITILERTAQAWGQGRSEGAFTTVPKPFHLLFTVEPGAGKGFLAQLRSAGAKEIEILEN